MMAARLRQRLHDQFHKIPVMPPHADAQRLNSNAAARQLASNRQGAAGHGPSLKNRRPAPHSPRAHHDNPPRVLVSWQEWIGSRFGHNPR
jgi:hypothetical protein